MPLRVAIIGSGPSAFYAAEPLLRSPNVVAQVDMFDRLPTPYGLVRGGVAPDHPKIKTVTKVYDKTAANPNFRFYGNVEFGKDVTLDELRKYYHAIIFAVGAQTVLFAAVQKTPDAQIFIRSDKSVRYEYLRGILKAAGGAGVTNVTFSVVTWPTSDVRETRRSTVKPSSSMPRT